MSHTDAFLFMQDFSKSQKFQTTIKLGARKNPRGILYLPTDGSQGLLLETYKSKEKRKKPKSKLEKALLLISEEYISTWLFNTKKDKFEIKTSRTCKPKLCWTIVIISMNNILNFQMKMESSNNRLVTLDIDLTRLSGELVKR